MSDRDYIALPREVATFLCGEVSLDGVWFGDKHPNSPGQFWWREFLRAALVAPTVKESLTAQLETLREENEKLREEIEPWQMTLVAAITLGEKVTAENERLRAALEALHNACPIEYNFHGEVADSDLDAALNATRAALRQEDTK